MTTPLAATTTGAGKSDTIIGVFDPPEPHGACARALMRSDHFADAALEWGDRGYDITTLRFSIQKRVDADVAGEPGSGDGAIRSHPTHNSNNSNSL